MFIARPRVATSWFSAFFGAPSIFVVLWQPIGSAVWQTALSFTFWAAAVSASPLAHSCPVPPFRVLFILVVGKINGLLFGYYTIPACCSRRPLFGSTFVFTFTGNALWFIIWFPSAAFLFDFIKLSVLSLVFRHNSKRLKALLLALIGFGIRVATPMRKSAASALSQHLWPQRPHPIALGHAIEGSAGKAKKETVKEFFHLRIKWYLNFKWRRKKWNNVFKCFSATLNGYRFFVIKKENL